MVSTALLQNFVDSGIGLRICSDHAWTEGDFYVKNLKTQRPQWKLDSNLLFIELIHTEIEKEIDLFFKTNSDCGVLESMMWDALKAVLRGKIIALMVAYRKEKAKHRNDLLQNIE